ncbi:hypothetical protein BCR36DRAFT_581453 [Piromyces finnis]|uniref:Uncharacterized protein n=1 Tax=Piromyces finnis TaxID=1754191 RepID=A0A1Y1VGA2_9FUNG|nr:hypothetical protein BCR36DRAFT_581453 [Piromyces finnis]|eukprot:ORX55438.1 hypothetical protein BCR36DRAFT_581453 [Piromyces finnis]
MEEPQQNVNLNYSNSLQTTPISAIRDYDYISNKSQSQQKNFSNSKGVTILKSVYRSLIPTNRKNKKILKSECVSRDGLEKMNDIYDRMSVLSVGNGQTNTVYLSRLFYQNCAPFVVFRVIADVYSYESIIEQIELKERIFWGVTDPATLQIPGADTRKEQYNPIQWIKRLIRKCQNVILNKESQDSPWWYLHRLCLLIGFLVELRLPEPVLIELRDKLWIISSLDQARTDEKVWNRIAETLCRIVYKIELKDKFKNRIMEANIGSICNSNIYNGSNQQIAFCEPLKSNINENLEDCYRSDSTLTSNNNIYSNVTGNFANQYNSVGIFTVTTNMNNNSVFNNLNSLPASINSLVNDFSKGLKISHVQSNLVSSSTTVNSNSTAFPGEVINDSDSMKNSMSLESEISLSVINAEDGLPMLLALQFEYIFSKPVSAILPSEMFLSFRNCIESFSKPISEDIINEVQLSTEYLCSADIPESEYTRSSRWFRISPRVQELRNIDSEGFLKYKENQYKIYLERRSEDNNTNIPFYVDCIVVASHIKSLIKTIPGGLIPYSIQLALMNIIDRITDQNEKNNKKGLFAANFYEQEKSEIETIRLLLRLSPGRLKLLQMIIKVAHRILSDCVIDPMTAASLARVLPVEDLSNLGEVSTKKQQVIFGLEGVPSNSPNTLNANNNKSEQSSLTSMLDIIEKWQAAWSYLVENPEEFIFKDDQSFDIQTECFKRSLMRIFS